MLNGSKNIFSILLKKGLALPFVALFLSVANSGCSVSPGSLDSLVGATSSNSSPSSAAASAGAPDKIAILAGNGQSSTVSSILSNPISILVTDSNGTPVPNTAVTFNVTSGGGAFVPPLSGPVNTNSAGMVMLAFQLGAASGTQTLTASIASGTTTSVTFNEIAASSSSSPPGAAKTIMVFGGNGQTATAGTTMLNPLTVKVIDAVGIPVPNVLVTFSPTTGAGSIATAAVVATDSAGIASAMATLGAGAGAQSFTASMPSGTTTSVVFSEVATPSIGAPSVISIASGNNQGAVKSAALGNPLVAKVVDANGVPVPGVAVTFAVATGGGVINSAATVNTDSSGIASANVTLGATVGAQTFTATMPSGATTSVTFSATAANTVGAANAVLIASGSNQSGVAGSALANPISVLVVDSNSVPVPGVNVTFAVASGGGSISTATTVATNSNGNASASVVLGNTLGAQSFTATIPSGATQTATFNMTGTTTVTVSAPTTGYWVNSSNKTAVPVTGTCSSGSNVSLSATDGSTIVTGSLVCPGTNTFSTTMNLNTLNDGTANITLTVSMAGAPVPVTVVFNKSTVAPNNATSLVWTTTSPSQTNNNVTASWTKSNSSNLSDQTIQFFNGTTCISAQSGSQPVGIGAAHCTGSACTFSFSTTSGPYSYKVTSISAEGNSGTSGCSTGMVLNAVSTTSSTLAVSSASIKKNQTSTITFTALDSGNVQNTIGGHTVVLSTSVPAAGSIGAVTDNGNGTYTATFTGGTKGNTTTITATIDGSAVVPNGGNPTIAITDTAPVITGLADSTYPLAGGNAPPILQGAATTLASFTDADGDSVTWTCTYSTLGLATSDPNYASSANCNTLKTLLTGGTNSALYAGTVSLSGSTVTWTPISTQRGTFQFTLTASDGTLSATPQTVTVTVRENSYVTNLYSALDALYSKASYSTVASGSYANGSANTNAWLNLISGGSSSSLSTFTGTANPWTGFGQTNPASVTPYSVNFGGTSDYLSMGSVLNTAPVTTKAAVSAWINPGDVSTNTVNRVIASNGGASGNGMVLRQSQRNPGRVEFAVGTKGAYNYKNYMIGQGPTNYFRLNDTNTTAIDQMGNANGTYTGTVGTNYIQNNSGPTIDGNKSTYFDGVGGYIPFANTAANNFKTNSPYTIEAWVNPNGTQNGTAPYIMGTYPSGNNIIGITYSNTSWPSSIANAFGFIIGDSSGNLVAVRTNNTFAGGSWYHIVATYNGSLAVSGLKIYINGVAQALTNCYTGTLVANSSTSQTWVIGALKTTVPAVANYYKGYASDVAIYPYMMGAQQVADHYQTGLTTNLINVPNQVVMDHPVAYYRMNESGGTAMTDYSGNGNTGTYVGQPAPPVSPVLLGQTSPLASAGTDSSSTSVKFDGASGHATFPNSTGPNFGASIYQQISLEAWVYPTSSGSNYYIISNAKGTAPQNGVALMYSTAKFFSFWVEDTVPGYLQATTTTAFNPNQWYHVVGTYTGVPGASAAVAVYVNGVAQAVTYNGTGMGGTTMFDGNTPTWCIGRWCNGGTSYFPGYITEAAVYNYALTSTQISNHYNVGGGAGWNYCQSKTALSTSLWDQVTGYWDGSSEYLYVNGQQECKTTPSGITYSGATANISVGSDTSQSSTSFWKGLLASIKIFGTSDNSNAIQTAGTTTPFSDFTAESNRFRQIPMEDIVTSNLVLNLDASNAQLGTAPYVQGTVCPSSGSPLINTANFWTDLSSQLTNGTLWGFTSCNSTTSGWTGTGSTGLPYSIALNGSTNLVSVPGTTANTFASVTQPFTIEIWTNPAAVQVSANPYVVGQFNASSGGNAIGYSNSWAQPKAFDYYMSDSNGDAISGYTNTTYNGGTWHHVVLTYDGSRVNSGAKIYVDGTSQAMTNGAAVPLSTSYTMNVTSNAWLIGMVNSYYFTGNIGAVRVYNAKLTAAQVIQNCNAQQARYGVSACASP